MASSPFVVDVTEATFEQEVMDASMQVPVVVDLWAEWCGPCKALGPVLEGLADSYGGAFKLAKVDVDANQRLAMAFQAQSIPMVVAVWNGQLVHQFMGALPKQQVERWLEEVFEAAGLEAKPKGPEVAPEDPAAALAFYADKLAANDQDHAARLGLGKLLMTQGKAEEARGHLDAIPGAAPEYSAAMSVLALEELLTQVGAAGGEAAVRAKLAADPDDVDAAYHVALADGATGDYAGALEVLVGQIAGSPKEPRDRAKASAQVLLRAAGRGDERVEALRKRLARLLF